MSKPDILKFWFISESLGELIKKSEAQLGQLRASVLLQSSQTTLIDFKFEKL